MTCSLVWLFWVMAHVYDLFLSLVLLGMANVYDLFLSLVLLGDGPCV